MHSPPPTADPPAIPHGPTFDLMQPTADYFKFCPGDERVKISNAVCRGRRRTSFPKCKGCQFNDDEAAQNAKSKMPTQPTSGPPASIVARRREPAAIESRGPSLESLFRETDIRGLCPLPFSDAVAWRIGYAASQFLRSRLKGYDRADPRARSLITACDARSSSAAIHPHMVSGVRAAGVTVYDIGVVDTPQLLFAVRHLGAGGGIITTGGRDPSAYSGFKIIGAGCRDVSTVTGLIDIRDIAKRVPQHETGSTGPEFEMDLSEPYREFVCPFMGGSMNLARPLTLVVDASNGVAAQWVPAVFGALGGLTLLMMNDTHAEPPAHEPEPTDSDNLSALRSAVREHKADLGICFDGDADACVFVDERGAVIRPDMLFAMLARHVVERAGSGVVVADHRMSRVVAEEIERLGGTLRRERPMSNQIKKAMTESNALLGGTLSGQVFYRDNANGESAFLTLSVVLNLLASSPRKLSERIKPLLRYRAAIVRRIRCDNAIAAIERVAEHHADAQLERIDGLAARHSDWWFHLTHGPDATLEIRAEAQPPNCFEQE